MATRFKITNHPRNDCSLGANWWAFALRGALALVFGALAMFYPFATLLALTVLFGAYTVVDGVFQLVSGINQARKGQRWGGLVLSGGLGVAAGLVMLTAPHWASLALALLLWATVATWAVATGLTLMTAAVRLRREFSEDWLMTLNGAILVTFGLGVFLLFWIDPQTPLVTFGLVIGLTALSSGVLNLMLAYRLGRREPAAPAKAMS